MIIHKLLQKLAENFCLRSGWATWNRYIINAWCGRRRRYNETEQCDNYLTRLNLFASHLKPICGSQHNIYVVSTRNMFLVSNKQDLYKFDDSLELCHDEKSKIFTILKCRTSNLRIINLFWLDNCHTVCIEY